MVFRQHDLPASEENALFTERPSVVGRKGDFGIAARRSLLCAVSLPQEFWVRPETFRQHVQRNGQVQEEKNGGRNDLLPDEPRSFAHDGRTCWFRFRTKGRTSSIFFQENDTLKDNIRRFAK